MLTLSALQSVTEKYGLGTTHVSVLQYIHYC